MTAVRMTDNLQHIQFEGCDVCVIAPEDYAALTAELAAARKERNQLQDQCGDIMWEFENARDATLNWEQACFAILGILSRPALTSPPEGGGK